MTDLDKLITAVEAGSTIAWGLGGSPSRKALPMHWHDAMNAYLGSLDAALRLHEALLPGWGYLLRSGNAWDCENHGCNPGDHMAHVMTPDWDSGLNGSGYASWSSTPARAWLLSILRALKAKGDA